MDDDLEPALPLPDSDHEDAPATSKRRRDSESSESSVTPVESQAIVVSKKGKGKKGGTHGGATVATTKLVLSKVHGGQASHNAGYFKNRRFTQNISKFVSRRDPGLDATAIALSIDPRSNHEILLSTNMPWSCLHASIASLVVGASALVTEIDLGEMSANNLRGLMKEVFVPVVQTLVSGDKTCDASKLRTPSSLHARFPSFPLHLFSEGDAHLDLSMWSIENMRCALRWSWIFSESVGLGSVESSAWFSHLKRRVDLVGGDYSLITSALPLGVPADFPPMPDSGDVSDVQHIGYGIDLPGYSSANRWVGQILPLLDDPQKKLLIQLFASSLSSVALETSRESGGSVLISVIVAVATRLHGSKHVCHMSPTQLSANRANARTSASLMQTHLWGDLTGLAKARAIRTGVSNSIKNAKLVIMEGFSAEQLEQADFVFRTIHGNTSSFGTIKSACASNYVFNVITHGSFMQSVFKFSHLSASFGQRSPLDVIAVRDAISLGSQSPRIEFFPPRALNDPASSVRKLALERFSLTFGIGPASLNTSNPIFPFWEVNLEAASAADLGLSSVADRSSVVIFPTASCVQAAAAAFSTASGTAENHSYPPVFMAKSGAEFRLEDLADDARGSLTSQFNRFGYSFRNSLRAECPVLLKSWRDGSPGTAVVLKRFEGFATVGSQQWPIPVVVDSHGKERKILPLVIAGLSVDVVRAGSGAVGSSLRRLDLNVTVLPLVLACHLTSYSAGFVKLDSAFVSMLGPWPAGSLLSALVRARMTVVRNAGLLSMEKLQPRIRSAKYAICSLAASCPELFSELKSAAISGSSYKGVVANLLESHPNVLDRSVWLQWATEPSTAGSMRDIDSELADEESLHGHVYDIPIAAVTSDLLVAAPE